MRNNMPRKSENADITHVKKWRSSHDESRLWTFLSFYFLNQFFTQYIYFYHVFLLPQSSHILPVSLPTRIHVLSISLSFSPNNAKQSGNKNKQKYQDKTPPPKETQPSNKHAMCSVYSGTWGLPQSVVDMSSNPALEKTDFAFPSRGLPCLGLLSHLNLYRSCACYHSFCGFTCV